MAKNTDMQALPKKRIRLGIRLQQRKPEEDVSEEAAELNESVENSTENTRKKTLPARANRGLRMKSLQGKELENENELYDLIFAEKSSDEDFNPSQTDEAEEDSIFENLSENNNKEESIQDDNDSDNKPESKRLQINSPKVPRAAGKSNSKKTEEILDLDMIDLDKIDELEDMRDRGIDIEASVDENYNSDLSSSELIGKKTKKTKNRKMKKLSKLAKPVILVQNNEVVNNDRPKGRSRGAFIDFSDDEEFLRKRHRSTKPTTREKKQIKKNKNVTFKNNNEVMIINKSILKECNVDSDNDQEDIMKYNDDLYRQNLEEENKNTKNIIKKFKKQENVPAPVKYTYMQEKLSQKELLLEAIFTEYYNIQSLQEMQRLDDLNKKEMSTPGKKQFSEFVRITKNNTIGTVTFSNPVLYENIFENFSRTNTSHEKRVCVITGLPAKYFDPLTKQPYSNKEAFKVLRERYFQKEEDSLLFRIQTLSDLASQKKEKLKKLILSEGSNTVTTNSNLMKNNSNLSTNILDMVNKYGILNNEGGEMEKKVTYHRIYNRNRENCVHSGMLVEANKKQLIISKKIFRDKYSSRISGTSEEA